MAKHPNTLPSAPTEPTEKGIESKDEVPYEPHTHCSGFREANYKSEADAGIAPNDSGLPNGAAHVVHAPLQPREHND